MSIFVMLTIILVTSLLTCFVLCYTVFILLKRIRILEQLLSESKSIMQNVSDFQTANLAKQTENNPLLLISSNEQENKGRIITGDESNKGDKIIH